jgi:hypothetical protein
MKPITSMLQSVTHNRFLSKAPQEFGTALRTNVEARAVKGAHFVADRIATAVDENPDLDFIDKYVTAVSQWRARKSRGIAQNDPNALYDYLGRTIPTEPEIRPFVLTAIKNKPSEKRRAAFLGYARSLASGAVFTGATTQFVTRLSLIRQVNVSAKNEAAVNAFAVKDAVGNYGVAPVTISYSALPALKN